MQRCPRCDLMLTTTTYAGHSFAGCDECGGVWASSQAWTELAQHAPALLATLDQQFNPSGARSLQVGRAPVCPQCGTALRAHHVAAAPQLGLLACAPCRGLWLQDGQCRQLMTALNPNLAAPARVVAQAVDDLATAAAGDDVESDAEATRDLLLAWWWPPPLPGQPLLPWLVCGMPLWCAATLAVALPTVGLALLAGATSLAAVLGLAATCAGIWVTHALFLLVALTAVWEWRDGAPDCTWLQRYLLLLRLSPVLNLVTLAVTVVVAQWNAVVAEWVALGVQALLIWQAAELEPLDVNDARAVMVRVRGGC